MGSKDDKKSAVGTKPSRLILNENCLRINEEISKNGIVDNILNKYICIEVDSYS